MKNITNKTTNLMITQSKKSVRRPFCVIYEKSGKRLCNDKTICYRTVTEWKSSSFKGRKQCI